MSKASMNIPVKAFVWTYIFMELLLHNTCSLTLFKKKKKLSNCFPEWLGNLTILPAMNDNSVCYTSAPTVGIVSI